MVKRSLFLFTLLSTTNLVCSMDRAQRSTKIKSTVPNSIKSEDLGFTIKSLDKELAKLSTKNQTSLNQVLISEAKALKILLGEVDPEPLPKDYNAQLDYAIWQRIMQQELLITENTLKRAEKLTGQKKENVKLNRRKARCAKLRNIQKLLERKLNTPSAAVHAFVKLSALLNKINILEVEQELNKRLLRKKKEQQFAQKKKDLVPHEAEIAALGCTKQLQCIKQSITNAQETVDYFNRYNKAREDHDLDCAPEHMSDFARLELQRAEARYIALHQTMDPKIISFCDIVRANNVELTQQWLQNGYNPNTYDEHITPLHIAVIHNFYDLTKLLLKHNASLNNYSKTRRSVSPVLLVNTPRMEKIIRGYQNTGKVLDVE